MSLDADALADVVLQTIDTALAPVSERLAIAETTLKALQTTPPDLPSADLAASFTGMLTKELDALEPQRTQKRVERDDKGNVVRVIEEPVT